MSYAAGHFLFTMMHLELHQINNRLSGLRTGSCDRTEVHAVAVDGSGNIQRIALS